MSNVNKSKYALLGVLSLMPCSGYDIKKFCDSSISHFWNENYARIYPVLKEMEKEGFVVKETEQTEGRPARNIFSITDQGKHELDEWLLTPVQSVLGRNELLLKLFFSSDAPLESILEKIEKEKERHQNLLAEFSEMERILNSNEESRTNKGLPFWLATLSFGKHNSEAIIQWCQETINNLSLNKVTEDD